MKNQLKKQHRQWIAFVLALLAALTVLASCKKDPSGGDDTQISGDTTTEQSPAELCLFGGSDTYNIIRSESETETVLKAVKELRNAVNGMFGDTWQGMVTEDWIQGVAKGDIVDNDNAEILIGLTNRRESHTVSETLGKDEYVIRAVGKKLVIIGSDEYATAQAVEAFIEQYLKNIPADKRVAVSATLDVKGEASLQKVPVNSEAQYRIMTWNLGCEVGKVEDAYTVMMKYLPDILSLQECNKAIHTKLINKLPKFYSVTTRFHANGTTYVYTPIIYNTETLDLKEAGAEWLRDRYTGTNTKSVAWAVFEGKNGGTPFAVIDFHGAVCSNAYKGYENLTKEQLNAQSDAWRTGNVKQVMEIRDRIVEKYGDIPLMVNGDCNFTTSHSQYKYLTEEKGMYDAEFTARLGTVTGYKTYFDYGTPIKKGPSIDHIFGISGIDFVEHYIVRDTEVLTASDHCPVYVDFNPKKP